MLDEGRVVQRGAPAELAGGGAGRGCRASRRSWQHDRRDARGDAARPGLRVIEHLSRTRRLDTYEVWSDERACSCVVKTLRPDRRDDERARAALLAEGRLLTALDPPAHRARLRADDRAGAGRRDGDARRRDARAPGRPPPGRPATPRTSPGSACTSPRRCATCTRHGAPAPRRQAVQRRRRRRPREADRPLARPRRPAATAPGIGTWCNLSPEQARGERARRRRPTSGASAPCSTRPRPASRRSTTTSRGPTTRRATGAPARTWHTDDQLEAGYPQLEARAPRGRAARRLPDRLAAAIDACLAPEPADRPSLDELIESCGRTSLQG